MWKLYTRGTDGFRIRSTVGKLWKTLPVQLTNRAIDKVKYKQRKLLKTEIRNVIKERFRTATASGGFQICTNESISYVLMAFMFKRFAYEYEKEVRLICHHNRESARGESAYGINENGYFSYRIPRMSLIEQILVHPRVSSKDYRTLEPILNSLVNESNITTKVEIKQSRLHDLELRSVESV